jgi:Na+-transporting NADH:ubiquinone oxidoreductase subunit NqrB
MNLVIIESSVNKPGTIPLIHTWIKKLSSAASDPRIYQISFLAVFLWYGLVMLGWQVDGMKFALIFFTCLLTQLVFTSFTTRDYMSLLSATISSFSLCLMLKTGTVEAAVLAAFLSIAEKFVLRYKGKHFFNPTNFGICVTILLTHQAWISPGQWGNNAFLLLLIGSLGFFVLIKVKRFDTALAFLITFIGLLAFRHIYYQGWPADFLLHQLQSGTLLLFTFFMITDPVSTPSHPFARIGWAAAVAVLAFVLQSYYFVNGAPVWALFFLSPTTLLLDKLFTHATFKWKTK